MTRREGSNPGAAAGRRPLRAGFTIVELLVSMVIVGVLLVALIGFTSTMLGFSARTSGVNVRLADLSDAIGYVSLNVRNAAAVWDGVGVQVGLDTFDCEVAATQPCLALLVPITIRSTDPDEDGQIESYELWVYRLETVSDWLATLASPDTRDRLEPLARQGWDGADTPVLLEYRSNGCPLDGVSLCPVAPDQVLSVAVGQPRLVMDGLVRSPGGLDFFRESAGLVTLRFQGAARYRGDLSMVPRDGPLVAELLLR